MRKQIVLKATILVAALTASFAAYADPTITVSDGVNNSGPISAVGGSVIYVSPAFSGSWSVVITAGTTKPVFGSAASPNLQLSVQATSLGSANDLTIT